MVIQDSMTDANVAKVDANAKTDDPNASDGSKIDTPKINMKIAIGKPFAIAIALYQLVSLRHKVLFDSQ